MHRIRPRRLALALLCLMGIAMISLPGCRDYSKTPGTPLGMKEETKELFHEMRRSSYKGNGKHRNQMNTPDGK